MIANIARNKKDHRVNHADPLDVIFLRFIAFSCICKTEIFGGGAVAA
jgi:hypothetical protein